MRAEYLEAAVDLRDGIANWRMWGRLGWQEIRRRYRRTVFGPFWSTLSLTIFVVCLGLIWSALWQQPISTYMPFVSVGVITWTLLAALITESCGVFISNEGLLKQMKISFTLLVCAVVWRNLIVFFHNMALFALIALLFRVPLGAATLLAIPGLLLLCVNAGWMGLLCGMACARFRDLQPLIASVLQVAVFVTPVFYAPQQLAGPNQMLSLVNPLFHLIDVVRAPLLGDFPAAASWAVAAACGAFGWLVTLYAFARFRHRVAFWL